MELSPTGRSWSYALYGAKPYRKIMELGFIWSKEYREIMELDFIWS